MSHDDQTLPVKHWEHLRTRLVWAFDREVASIYHRRYYGPHPIAAWWLKCGSVKLNFGDGEEVYEEGAWVFPRRSEGVQAFSPNARIVSIRFYAEWPNGRTLFDRSKSISFPAGEAPALSEAAVDLIAAAPPQKDKAFYLTLEQFLNVQPFFDRWIAAYFQKMVSLKVEPCLTGAFNEKVRHILYYLRHRAMETPLHDKEMAAVAGLSISQLHRTFIRELGVSPLTIWNLRRLEVARFDLENDKDSIKSISFNLGFSSPEHFCKWFKQQTGSSPREYRQQRR